MTVLTDIDFLIIGATKSATTWLQRSLQLDQAICMPDPEIHYFSREYHRGDDWYLAQFPPLQGDLLVGEKSNSYLESAKAASRIRTALPHAKLIAQLRNPVERAYSDYCMLYRRGVVNRDIQLHLDPFRAKQNRFLEGGLYHQQIKAYLEHYPSDQLLVLLYEDMLCSPEAQLALVREYLGLPASTSYLPINDKVKDKTTPMIAPALRRYLRPFKPAVAHLRENHYFKIVHRHLARPIEYPILTADLRERLVDYYGVEIEALGKLMKRDLSTWLQEAPSITSTTQGSGLN